MMTAVRPSARMTARTLLLLHLADDNSTKVEPLERLRKKLTAIRAQLVSSPHNFTDLCLPVAAGTADADDQ
jgi:hypothetical protein